jgi:hypothetical protein
LTDDDLAPQEQRDFERLEDEGHPEHPGYAGHAPGHIRQGFLDWVQIGCDPKEMVTVGDEVCHVRWVIDRLWHCTDVMPHSACDHLDIRRGSTFGEAMHALARDLIG